jgi:hypothetical protein
MSQIGIYKFLARGLPVARTAQSERQEKPFESCFQGRKEQASRRVAQEIYDALCSVQLLLPEAARSPVELLNRRAWRFIAKGIEQGRTFKGVRPFETQIVKFVGTAAGALEAVRLGALDPISKKIFESRLRQAVSTLGNPVVTALRTRKAGRNLLDRIEFTDPAAQLKLEKLHQIELLTFRRDETINILTFRVIVVDFHPHLHANFLS